MTDKRHWYFEDFFVGQELHMGSRLVTAEEIIAFATQFDPQPFHLDPVAAEESIFGGLVASGWHTCSMMMRLVVDGLLGCSSSLGSPGLDRVRWILPVRAGDTLSVTYVTKEVRASGSKPDRGVVVSVWQASNQRGELVATVEGMGMFRRRPAAAAEAPHA
ncbi:MAG TPA: dehydratase [Janthinobacterium sp.]|nr:dehydratase [Janthinobacterium sp.]